MNYSVENGFDFSGMDLVSLGATKAYFLGFPIKLGYELGNDSVLEILKEYQDGNLDFSSIYGHFHICIINTDKEEKLIFSDNSGICKIYYDSKKSLISSSLLSLLQSNNEYQLCPEGVAEFLKFGAVYFDKTVIDDVQVLPRTKVVQICQSKVVLQDKKLPPITDCPDFTFQDFFQQLLPSLEKKKISLDITGGSDSRMLVALFKNANQQFELSITGEETSQDVKIAREIAEKIRHPFYLTKHKGSNVADAELKYLCRLSDGMLDLSVYHRLSQYYQERKRRSVELQVSGAGGELYKDFWWLQDFPFYNKKTANLSRLYDMRIAPLSLNERIFTMQYREMLRGLKERTISKFREKFVSETNTQTYDQIYYEYKMVASAGTLINIANKSLLTYSPLLEYDLFRIGYNMPRFSRFFNLFQRKIISKNRPLIARIKTTDGHGLSANVFLIFKDVITYFIDKFKRVIKFILKKILKKTYFQESPVDKEIYNQIRKSKTFTTSVASLKSSGVLDKDLKVGEIPDMLVGKICSLGYLTHNYIK
ncbi:MAG: hypothetical protein CMP75_04325 [Flavobacteriales bacterium]|nr:hypothetical protein [Flavobacteriales bacterium]|tara:strand:- start:9676 stop:11286 length:1611 start_codon:yes stop_codon:yes gene_type:complete